MTLHERIASLEAVLRALVDAVESHDNIYDYGLSSHHETMERAREVLSQPMESAASTNAVDPSAGTRES